MFWVIDGENSPAVFTCKLKPGGFLQGFSCIGVIVYATAFQQIAIKFISGVLAIAVKHLKVDVINRMLNT